MTRIDMAAVPAARIDDLVMTEAGDEVLVYDQKAHHIHHLNRVSAVIWRQCDGQRSVDDIAAAATRELGDQVGEDAVRLALRKLADADLLAGDLSAGMRGTSRRAFMKKAAIAGAVPAVVSVSAPAASAAGSCQAGDATVCTTGPNGNNGAGCCVGGVHGVCSGGSCRT